MNAKIMVDAAVWFGALSVAAMGVAANQDWSTTHGQFVGAGAILAVVVAALKNVPDIPAAPAAPPVA